VDWVDYLPNEKNQRKKSLPKQTWRRHRFEVEAFEKDRNVKLMFFLLIVDTLHLSGSVGHATSHTASLLPCYSDQEGKHEARHRVFSKLSFPNFLPYFRDGVSEYHGTKNNCR
jgi:hypothetical protein